MSLEVLDYPDAAIWMHVDSEIERTLRINACKKEPETVEWICGLPQGDYFWDIGACCGSYSLLAAHRGLHVRAFEPAPFNVRRLRENNAVNGLSIEIEETACGDYDGWCDFKWSNDQPGSALHTLRDGHLIKMMRLDSVDDPVDHIKIDVDGSELRVVKGGMKTWPKVQSVQVEIDDSLPRWPETIGLLQDAGLQIEKWTRHGTTSISNVLFRR